MGDLINLKEIFEFEPSLAVAFASILALINIRNIHLSDVTRKTVDKLRDYINKAGPNKIDQQLVSIKKMQIEKFTIRYWWTGFASRIMIAIIPIYLFAKILHKLENLEFAVVLFLICLVLFFLSTLILINDQRIGKKTLHLNNLTVGVESSSEPSKLMNEIEEFILKGQDNDSHNTAPPSTG